MIVLILLPINLIHSFKIPEKGIDVGLEVTVDKPKGIIAFTNARIITMKGDEVIENGTVVVEGNLIKASWQEM